MFIRLRKILCVQIEKYYDIYKFVGLVTILIIKNNICKKHGIKIIGQFGKLEFGYSALYCRGHWYHSLDLMQEIWNLFNVKKLFAKIIKNLTKIK